MLKVTKQPWRPFQALGCLYLFALGLGIFLTPACLNALQAETGLKSHGPSSEEEIRDSPLSKKGNLTVIPEQTRYLAHLGVDRWNGAGFRGQGTKIAVLDSGFRGYRTFLGKVLPDHVTVRSFRPDGNLEDRDSQHGILCGEVLHTLAPKAELLFANWDLENPASFLEAVRWARQQGARVISCSVITPDWSDGDGGGEIHQELAHILGSGGCSGDVLFFASAGNTAERHWYGQFHAGADGFHEWQKGQEDNILIPWGTEPVLVELYCHPDASYDLYAFDVTANREVGHAPTVRDHLDRHYAVARFMPEEDHVYEVRVRLTQGLPGWFHMVALSSDSLRFATPRGSISFPADGREVIAMGAVDSQGHRLSYSSCGPNAKQEKPDFVALVPFPSARRREPFGGTSAAAPEGAAEAALWWSRHPEWSADQVHAALRSSAHHLGPLGDEWETGFGLITMPSP